MSTTKELHEVKYADRLSTGMVIVFTDGKQGLFPAALLYEMLPRSEPLPEPIPGQMRTTSKDKLSTKLTQSKAANCLLTTSRVDLVGFVDRLR